MNDEIQPGSYELPASDEHALWHSYNPDSDTVIIFVHGAFSNSRDAWLHQGEDQEATAFWPQLVCQDENFDKASVFLGGYYTAIDSGDFGIRDAANDLMDNLSIKISPADRCVLDISNILFIAHSTGGIVVRHMLTRNVERFRDKAIGLVLAASPSVGSRDANRLKFVADFLNNELGKQLQWHHPFLDELDLDFKNLVHDRKIPKLVGIEWIEHRLVKLSERAGFADWIVSFFRDKSVIVELDSAGRYFGEPKRLAKTDHFSIVKPKNERHLVYYKLRHFYEIVYKPLIEDKNVDEYDEIDGALIKAILSNKEKLSKGHRTQLENVSRRLDVPEAIIHTLIHKIKKEDEDTRNIEGLISKYNRNRQEYAIRISENDDRYYDHAKAIIESVQYYSCFISYSSKDDEIAMRIHHDLEDRGIECFYAPDDMKTGDLINESIDREIRLKDKLLLIVSEESIDSGWVKREVSLALDEEYRRDERVLFPIRIDDSIKETEEDWAVTLRSNRHIGDFTNWNDINQYNESIDRLVKDLMRFDK